MSGERQDGRERIDKSTRYMIEKGGVPADIAKKLAREARIRNEQRDEGDRK